MRLDSAIARLCVGGLFVAVAVAVAEAEAEAVAYIQPTTRRLSFCYPCPNYSDYIWE
jgi:hypothetical protein